MVSEHQLCENLFIPGTNFVPTLHLDDQISIPFSRALDHSVISTSFNIPLKENQFKTDFLLGLATEKHPKLFIAHVHISRNSP